MAVNDIIKEADYNTIRNNLVSVMGTGVSNYGWGQNARILSSAVAVGDRVSINDWGKLRYDIINAYNHLYGTTPTTAQALEGGTIRYSSTFTPDTGTIDSPVTQYANWVNTISANRFLVGTGQSATTVAVDRSFTVSFTTTASCVVEVKFNTADEARYFFNSGAVVRITSSKTNSTVDAQNNAWVSLLSSAGTQTFGANTPGTGTSPANGQNWYRMTNVDQQWYSVASSSPYGSNTYKIYSRCNVANNSNGTAAIGYFLVQFNDGYTDPGPGGPPFTGDAVNGTFRVSVDCVYPSGIMSPPGTGNFTVTLPTISIGAMTAS